VEDDEQDHFGEYGETCLQRKSCVRARQRKIEPGSELEETKAEWPVNDSIVLEQITQRRKIANCGAT